MTEGGVRWRSLIADFAMLACGGLVLLIFLVAVPPKRRGFFCEDETIRYPFHNSTIPNYALYIFGFSIPISVIVITEVFSNRKVRTSGICLFRPAPLWVLCLYKSLVDFLFGCVASQLVTDIGKYTIGRLRPNFIAVCDPRVGVGKLDVNDCSAFNHTYIEKYVCANGDNDASESRVSFPSGHSSFSAYTMLYIAIYVQVKVRVGRKTTLRLYKAGFQLSVILLSYFTALSRVMDNKHHWSDVLAGGLIGSITAALIARYVSGLTDSTRRGESDNNGKGFHDLTSIGAASDVEAARGTERGTSKPQERREDTRPCSSTTALLLNNISNRVNPQT